MGNVSGARYLYYAKESSRNFLNFPEFNYNWCFEKFLQMTDRAIGRVNLDATMKF